MLVKQKTNNNIRNETDNDKFDFANNNIITHIIDLALSQNYLNTSLSDTVKRNICTFISGCNNILNKWKQDDKLDNRITIEAILQLSTLFTDYIIENKNTVFVLEDEAEFNQTIEEAFTSIEDSYGNLVIHSLELPKKKTTPFTDDEILLLKSAICFLPSTGVTNLPFCRISLTPPGNSQKGLDASETQRPILFSIALLNIALQ